MLYNECEALEGKQPMKLTLLTWLSSFLWALTDSRWNWLFWASLICLAVGGISGWEAYKAVQHNVPLNGVVVLFGPGSNSRRGSIPMFYLSTLIAYSVLGVVGFVAFVLIWRGQNRRNSTPSKRLS